MKWICNILTDYNTATLLRILSLSVQCTFKTVYSYKLKASNPNYFMVCITKTAEDPREAYLIPMKYWDSFLVDEKKRNEESAHVKTLPKVIAVDFDGTLFENNWPGIGKPRRNIIAYVLYRQSKGAKIILWTNREGIKLTEALEACKKEGLIFDAVNSNLPERIAFFNSDPRKIGADEYIDDKAINPKDIIGDPEEMK